MLLDSLDVGDAGSVGRKQYHSWKQPQLRVVERQRIERRREMEQRPDKLSLKMYNRKS